MAALTTALMCALALAFLAPATAVAEPPPPPPYVDAVQRALAILRGAATFDALPAVEALRVLIDGTGDSQPEIIADLGARPPLYDDARTRLSALLKALLEPARTSDPQLAQQRLHDVLSMSRYDSLHRPPSAWDRFLQWVQDRIAALFRLLFGPRNGGVAPVWTFYAAGFAVLAAVAFVLVRAGRGRFSQSVNLTPEGPRAPADFFAEADRLAAAQDRLGAIRALCAGVAATLAGERSWEGSSLTVREIFRKAPDFKSLQPLLLPFEAAVYGSREVDQPTYEKAAAVAARFRQPRASAEDAA
ncbi:MAG TPA: hypothetical protein VJP81_09300 [Candidatus Dormibacteraeota bacterium]|nr:hypothetical protein [Candidatus Dormibacteraeota bacterium]